LVGGDDVVADDDPLMLHAEDLLEVDATEPNTGSNPVGGTQVEPEQVDSDRLGRSVGAYQ